MDEFLLAHIGAQGIVHLLLVPQAVHCFFHHVFPTGRTGSVCGINNYIVGQRHDFIAQAVKEITGQVFLGNCIGFLGQVGATNIAKKKGVSAKNSVVFSVFIAKKIGRTFHGVPRGVQSDKGNFTEGKFLTVFCDNNIKIGIGVRTVDNRGACFFRQG